MALNTSHSPDSRGVVIYNGEMILLYIKEVNVEFSKLTASSGDPAFKGKKKGKLYLTSHRVIFVNKEAKDRLLSFAMPFHCLNDVKLEQPVFGANYLKGVVLAQPGGNWEGEAVFTMTFNQGGCIDFGKALLRSSELARRQVQFNAPPAYAPPAGSYFAPPPTYYMAPAGAYHGFNPPRDVFPDNPPPDGVFMYEAPPPYPGIAPMQPQMMMPVPPPAAPGGAYSKAEEAFAGSVSTTSASTSSEPSAPPQYDDIMRGARA